MDQTYRINNSCTGFNKDLNDFKNILQKNQYPLKLIDHIVKSYLNDKINSRNEKSSENTEWEIKIRYFKLPFIGLNSWTKAKESTCSPHPGISWNVLEFFRCPGKSLIVLENAIFWASVLEYFKMIFWEKLYFEVFGPKEP